MNIWLLSDCEPLPGKGRHRLMRVGLLYAELLKEGHNVCWFTNTFDHGSKTFLYNEQTELPSSEGNGKIILLHSKVAYSRNVALSRLRFHSNLARAFLAQAKRMEKPDLIFCAWPPMHFGDAAVKFGNENNVPVIVDVRDLWPDIFIRALPTALQGIGKLGILPYELMTRRAFANATGITAIIPSHMEWSLKKAGKSAPGPFDRIFHLFHERTKMTDAEREQELIKWEEVGVTKDTYNLCYFGTISTMTHDFDAAIAGFKSAVKRRPELRMVICGDGDGMARFKAAAEGCNEIVFAGWSNAPRIQSLMEISKVGLYVVRNLPDFINSFTNKGIGYLAEGLPILTSLSGFAKTYLEEHCCGLGYKEGDAADFEAKLFDLMDDEELRLKMSTNCIDCFMEDFEVGRISKKLATYFEEVINANPHP